jgi:hypothetical protein
MPTTIAGKYEVLERIGGGGQGTVYRVRHLFLEEVRALKVQEDPGQGATDSVVRVLREGRALARLRHPHIVQVFDLGRDGTQHYLEMEYVDGPNLAQWLRTAGRPSLRDALTIARQIASALAYAHALPPVDPTSTSAGMIHRDIKPSNILLRRGETIHALLADFGLVKLSDGSDRTQLGSLMGTYRYSAPEQLGLKRDGKRAVVDQRADVFSLGLVLYELIEGRPFHGALGSEEVIARLLVDREPLEPTFSVPVDPELVTLVRAMVQRHPEERLQGGMTEVVRTLDRAMTRLPSEPKVVPHDASDDDRTQLIGVIPPAVQTTRNAASAGRGGGRPASEDATAVSAGATMVVGRATSVSPPAVPPAAVPPSRPRTVETPRPVAPTPRVAWLPWVAGAGLAAVIAAVVVLWPTSAPPPKSLPTPAPVPSPAPPLAPLRFAAIDPAGTAALRVPIGERERFAVTVAEADRHPDVGVVWHLDGREAGRGTTFEFRPEEGDGGATRTIEAVARAADERVSQTWTVSVPAVPVTIVAARPDVEPAPPVAVVAPTTPPATVAPAVPTPPPPTEGSLAIAARNPAVDRIALAQGDSVEFSVRPADEAGHYRYAWFLDGRPVGTDPTWRYRATPGPVARVPIKVEVEVADEQGRTSERIAWRIDVRTPPPKIVATTPASRDLRIALGETPELGVRATPGRPDAPLRYEWRIDRMPARISKQGTLAIPYDLAVGKHTIEVIAVDDEEDRSSAPQKFTVTVSAPAAPPAPPVERRTTSTPPAPRAASVEPTPTASGRVSEAEARQWMDRVRSAWDRKDRNALRELGELPDGKVPRGKVTIGEASIIIDAAGANVWYERVEDGVTASKRARLVRDASGKVMRR